MKNNGGESSGGKIAGKLFGCLVSIFGLPLVMFVLLILVLMWVMISLFSCGTEVVLEDILGVEISDEDEQMLRSALESEKTVYDQIGSYFRSEGCPEQAATAQAFYILYREDVLQRDDYLASLYYCFADGVRLRTIERVRERFLVELTEEDLDMVIAYSRSTYLDTSGYRPEKNGADLAKLAQTALAEWRYYAGSYGQVMSLDKPYVIDYNDAEVWQLLGFRTVDNLGLIRAYAWLDKDTGEIAASQTNEIITNYEDAAAVYARAIATYPIDDLVAIGEPGMGVYDPSRKMLGVYVGDGEVIYADSTTQTIVQESVTAGGWSACFYFAGMDYYNLYPGEAELYIVIYSNYLTNNSGVTLELWGPDSYSRPLYFSGGSCTIDIIVTAGDYHASLQNFMGEIPVAVYGEWRDFTVEDGEYYEIEYLIDDDVLGGVYRNIAVWRRAVRWLPRNFGAKETQ